MDVCCHGNNNLLWFVESVLSNAFFHRKTDKKMKGD